MYNYKTVGKGVVVKIAGSVIDIQFPDKQVPSINTVVYVVNNGQKIWFEVASQIGNNVVRAIALGATEGIYCGMEAINTGEPITVPVGKGVIGRTINVMGEAVDNLGEIQTDEYMPIYRNAPTFA